ncbi:MAG: fluoride efflux transporter CrcB [Rhizobiales bacterium]|nr:fluoride efflux transporter CrcB [Hyphomicrobiales bacterium]
MNYLIVFVGAGIGGALRHGANMLGLRLAGPDFPYATLAVNIAGSLAMGLVAGIFLLKADLPYAWRLFLTTGLLGGFTTFSAFSLDAVALYERGEPLLAALYVGGSVILSIAGLWAGLSLVRALLAA